MLRTCCTIAVLMALCLPLAAQDTTGDEPEVTVVVTAERSAQPVSQSISSATVVTAKQIRDAGARTVGDALKIVPGVVVNQNGQTGAFASAKLRGASYGQVLILVDGQRLSSSAFGGGADLSKLPLVDVARIEVIRGPVSSLYGSDAVGGVINIITKRPTGTTGEMRLGFGDFSRRESSLHLTGGTGALAWQLTAQAPQFVGSRPNSDYTATDISGRVTLPSVLGWRLDLRANDYHDALGLPGSLTFPSPNDRQWWDRSSFNLSATRKLGDGLIELRGYTAQQELREINPDWWTDTRITGDTRTAELSYTLDRGAHHWIVGGEYRAEDYRDVESGSVQADKGIVNRALFIQDRIDLSRTMDALVGLRVDDHSAAGSKLSPRIGVTHALSSTTQVRASYSEGFRAPSLVDLYYNNFGTTGNPDLKPEKSRQYEVGVNAQVGKDTLDIALFTSSVVDQIIWQPLPPEPGNPYPGTFENVDEARQRGIELAWTHPINDVLNLAMSYTYLDAMNVTTDSRLPGIPRNQIGMTLTGKFRGWGAALTGRYSDERPYSTGIACGAAVLDLTITGQGAAATNPYLTIRNLTGVKYQEVYDYPAEGRSIELGMRSAW